MRARAWVVVAGLAATVVAGCSGSAGSSGSDRAAATPTRARHDVEVSQSTFVDTGRPTAANGEAAATPGRTLVTDIVRPADDDGAPYPLIAFAHGFGGTFEYYEPILREWAAAGFVVVAPRFPLTYAGAPGGINAADVENQPGDISFVIDRVLDGPLAGVVDADAIGAAGHSNGGITTLGLVGNTCCRDERIDAAVVLAGTPSPYSAGAYRLTDMPPVLFAHGTEDDLISYAEAVRLFNAARGPKGLLTMEGADHGGWLTTGHEGFEPAVRATTDFWKAYLRGEGAALARLPGDGVDGVATMTWAGDDGSTRTLPTVPPPVTDRKASASTTEGLRDGEQVQVTWSGYSKGTVNIVQCVGDGAGGAASCAIRDGIILHEDPDGAGTLPLTIRVGEVGNGVCDATHPCSILVNDSGLQEPGATIQLPITFAP